MFSHLFTNVNGDFFYPCIVLGCWGLLAEERGEERYIIISLSLSLLILLTLCLSVCLSVSLSLPVPPPSLSLSLSLTHSHSLPLSFPSYTHILTRNHQNQNEHFSLLFASYAHLCYVRTSTFHSLNKSLHQQNVFIFVCKCCIHMRIYTQQQCQLCIYMYIHVHVHCCVYIYVCTCIHGKLKQSNLRKTIESTYTPEKNTHHNLVHFAIV